MFHDDVFEAAFEFEEAYYIFPVIAGQRIRREAISGLFGIGSQGFGGVRGNKNAGFFAAFAFLVDLKTSSAGMPVIF